MEICTRGNMNMEKLREMESLLGVMEDIMRGRLKMINKMGKGPKYGLMVENTLDNGKTVKNMGLEPTHLQTEKVKKEDGKKEKEYVGFDINLI